MADTPADAIRELYRALEGVYFTRPFVAHDMANIRSAYRDDAQFAAAITAVAREIVRAKLAPELYGVSCEHQLSKWRRSKFPLPGAEVTLRLVFRPHDDSRLVILAFGHRDFPDSVYERASGEVVAMSASSRTGEIRS